VQTQFFIVNCRGNFKSYMDSSSSEHELMRNLVDTTMKMKYQRDGEFFGSHLLNSVCLSWTGYFKYMTKEDTKSLKSWQHNHSSYFKESFLQFRIY
jgi:hypothetical protein